LTRRGSAVRVRSRLPKKSGGWYGKELNATLPDQLPDQLSADPED